MKKADLARQFISQNPDIPIREVHHAMHKKYPDVWPTYKRAWATVDDIKRSKGGFVSKENGTEKHSSQALTEEQVRIMFDIRAIVLSELRKLNRGEYWRDSDFVRRFQGKAGYRSVLDSPDAAPYRGKASGQVLWSHPDSIQKMRNDGVLI